MIILPEGWQGEIPFYLVIVRDEQANVIDLDEQGWLTKHADLLRGESTWHLVAKDHNQVAFSMAVFDGEQPYYVARHFAQASMALGGEQAHVAAYGIGKKRLDGHVDRLWIFPTGQVCAGDDVDIFGRAALAQMQLAGHSTAE